MAEPLSVDTVGDYLAGRGLIARGAPMEVEELGGGISNVVLSVSAGGRDLVVKQALPRLRVKEEWLAKRERAVTEGEALRLAAGVTPGRVPEVADVDREACAITIARAPRAWKNWKELLLAGAADPAIAAELGRVLAAWHRASLGDGAIAARFGDFEAFGQLRIDPYHRTVARRHPDLAPAVLTVIDAMEGRRLALVHGDYSPKNVLVGDGGALWVLDFEVAHYGDPVFDLAFMLNHLRLKAIHRPQDAVAYERCAVAFCAAYGDGAPSELALEPPYLAAQTACLMVARVDGKSPAEYLTEEGRAAARELGRSLLLDPPGRLEELWRR